MVFQSSMAKPHKQLKWLVNTRVCTPLAFRVSLNRAGIANLPFSSSACFERPRNIHNTPGFATLCHFVSLYDTSKENPRNCQEKKRERKTGDSGFSMSALSCPPPFYFSFAKWQDCGVLFDSCHATRFNGITRERVPVPSQPLEKTALKRLAVPKADNTGQGDPSGWNYPSRCSEEVLALTGKNAVRDRRVEAQEPKDVQYQTRVSAIPSPPFLDEGNWIGERTIQSQRARMRMQGQLPERAAEIRPSHSDSSF